MFELYTFNDWNGNLRIMLASTIHKKVIEDSKQSNYNWIAPAKELINVCTKKNFPIEYSIDIMAAILNCFASLINIDDDTSYCKNTDIQAVYYAYNSLFDVKNETAIKARINFLNGFLSRICWNSWQFLFHQGDSFTKVCNDWQTAKLNELILIKDLNFDKIKVSLEKDFINVIKEAEKNGVFVEDDKRAKEIQKKIIEDSVNDFNERYGTPDKPKSRFLNI